MAKLNISPPVLGVEKDKSSKKTTTKDEKTKDKKEGDKDVPVDNSTESAFVVRYTHI